MRDTLIGLLSQPKRAFWTNCACASLCAAATCSPRAANALFLIGRDEPAHLLDQRRQRGLCVASNRQVDVGVASVVVNVAVLKEMLGRDADRLASIRSCGAGERTCRSFQARA